MYTESKYLRSDTEKIEEVYSAIFNTKINIKLKLDRKYVFVKNMVAEINFKEVITHQNALEILEYIYSGTYPVYSAEKFEKIDNCPTGGRTNKCRCFVVHNLIFPELSILGKSLAVWVYLFESYLPSQTAYCPKDW